MHLHFSGVSVPSALFSTSLASLSLQHSSTPSPLPFQRENEEGCLQLEPTHQSEKGSKGERRRLKESIQSRKTSILYSKHVWLNETFQKIKNVILGCSNGHVSVYPKLQGDEEKLLQLLLSSLRGPVEEISVMLLESDEEAASLPMKSMKLILGTPRFQSATSHLKTIS
ncbi:hypothetical protein MRB53_009331 [Persea americana]|uniref:Uncharacterized protein n=1 Tax=Persea americana TaxID=3435 RepID=A0ACC2LNQ5_PERAE|nr:hypothetical protein MRB53_009331 [Persea americana]